MTRMRTQRKQGYFIISNETSQDHSLSFEALGLLTYCLSMPEEWDFNPKLIWKQRSTARDKTYEIFDELIRSYHCIRIRSPNPKAKNLPGEVSYEMFDDKEDCIARVKELEKTDAFIEHAGKVGFKKCFRHPEYRDTEGGDPNSQYNIKEKEKKKEDIHRKEIIISTHSEEGDGVPAPKACGANNKIPFYSCLDSIDVLGPSQKRKLMAFPEPIVTQAVRYYHSRKEPHQGGSNGALLILLHFCNNPEDYREYMANLDKPPETKMSKREKLLSNFKRGKMYGPYEFDFDTIGVGFIDRRPGVVGYYSVRHDSKKFIEEFLGLLKKLGLDKKLE